MRRYVVRPLVVIVGLIMSNSYAQAWDDGDEIECLARNIYFEARGDNLAGQFAIADVTLNRVYSVKYPKTICAVVHQGVKDSKGKVIRYQCQFNWYCSGRSNYISDEHTNEAWLKARKIAVDIYFNNTYRGITEGATHYHSSSVNPPWVRSMRPVGRIGSHLFYSPK